jgi:hypothetical protein
MLFAEGKESLLLQLYQRLQVVVEVAIQTQLLIAKLPPFHRGSSYLLQSLQAAIFLKMESYSI